MSDGDPSGEISRDRGLLRGLSLVALILMVLALVGLWVTHSLFFRSPAVIGVQVAAVALMIWARVTFGLRSFHATANPTAGGLVTTGPYRFIRHPIYTAACLLGWAGLLGKVSVLSVSLCLLLLIAAVGRMLCEERLVVEQYPEYREFAKVTKRMLPYVY
jgi:protein-S-isoprenylcysteine O-methyltransferase Ste14